ncbi:MAG: hypothetical protein WBV70_03815 [Candidatus Bathyarchaeia archaeon]
MKAASPHVGFEKAIRGCHPFDVMEQSNSVIVFAIYVEPDGRIAICKQLYIGNAFKTDIIDMIENYDPFNISEARAIVENGTEGLTNWARERGVEPDPEGYYSICHLCVAVRRRASARL